jgi:hypothetical protein
MAGYYTLEKINQSTGKTTKQRVNVLVYEVNTMRMMRRVLTEAATEHATNGTLELYAYAHPDDVAEGAWLARLTVIDGKPGRLDASNDPQLMRTIVKVIA